MASPYPLLFRDHSFGALTAFVVAPSQLHFSLVLGPAVAFLRSNFGLQDVRN